ncbi:expressed unknown protein [Seminavis robusta]|uniref:Hexosyltransferase n=1 Tax=Seminavis robusta TaxID=568900 RepID=A0A9N8EAV7_9STRA|nr:expressed unknown protein [Seminavis robusta]|eukprot:Sro740_g195620.1 n/a (375) ;mRNA; r:43024-44148
MSTRSVVVIFLFGVCLGLSVAGMQFSLQLGSTTGDCPSSSYKESLSANAPPSTTTSSTTSLEPLHILFGMSGNDPGFFEEFQVCLKSVLLNAPHQRATHIHIMADQEAFQTLHHTNATHKGIFETIQLQGAPWFQDITISTYNVQSHVDQWSEYIRQRVNHQNYPATEHHTVGAYFRLFPQQVIPNPPEFMLYLDTDVAVMANMAGMLPYADPTYTFIMSESCTGVMWIHVPKLDQFWNHYVPQRKWDIRIEHDQNLILGVAQAFPNDPIVQVLSPTWDLQVAKHWRHVTRQQLLALRPDGIGLIHYNGGGASKGSSFRVSDFVTKDWAQDGWAIPALYYRELPWEWVKFMGRMMVEERGGGGGTIRIQTTTKH